MSGQGHTMFTVFQLLMLVDGFFMWSLIGQGLLGLLIGPRRQDNIVYKLLGLVTHPLIAATRVLMPRFVRDSQLGPVAVVLLILLRLPLYFVWYANGWIPHGVGTPIGQ